MRLASLRIAEVALRVSDLDRSVAFYCDELGFEVPKTGQNVVFLTVGPLPSPLGDAGHPQLFALFKREIEIDAANSTFDHIAFEIDPDDYESELERFKSREMVIREREWPETLLWKGRSRRRPAASVSTSAAWTRFWR